MARDNKLGTSFLGLGLTQDEAAEVRAAAKDKGISAKAYIRYLIRKELTTK